jgi:hypothetical protein
VFGPEFAKGDVVKAAADGVTEGASLIGRFLDSTAAHLSGIVDIVKDYGISILPPSFTRPAHMQEPAGGASRNRQASP